MLFKDRKLNRMPGYDYSQQGLYFVTICTKGRECYFGDIINSVLVLNKVGKIVINLWLGIPKHFNNVELDEWVVMPNHIHGIICINRPQSVGDVDLRPLRKNLVRNKMLLSKIIHGFKSSVSRVINNKQFNFNFAWQR